MITEMLLRFLYGAIVITAGFLIGSMFRLLRKEVREIGLLASLNSIYSAIAFYVFSSSVGHVIICGYRVVQSFHGVRTSASYAPALAFGFFMLLAGKVGFSWAGTRRLQHGRTIWWSLMVTMLTWAGVVAGWQVG